MEKILNSVLDAVRFDAIMKLKNVDNISNHQQNQVIDAAKTIMKLADLARKEGLLALEDMIDTITSDYLKQLIILVVDGTFPEIIIEIATNIYWTNASDGVNSMVDYIYLRGMLSIQNGENLRVLDKLLMSLMPSKLRSGRSAVLLPPSPLRTVRESFPSYGSSTYKPCCSNRASSSFSIE